MTLDHLQEYEVPQSAPLSLLAGWQHRATHQHRRSSTAGSVRAGQPGLRIQTAATVPLQHRQPWSCQPKAICSTISFDSNLTERTTHNKRMNLSGASGTPL